MTATAAATSSSLTSDLHDHFRNDSNPCASGSETPSGTVPHVPIPRRGVDYRGKIVLAPMVRSGELPSRLLALHYGADLVWGPETVDRSMIGTVEEKNPRTGCIEWTRTPNTQVPEGKELHKSVIYRIDPSRESSKLIFQIGTNSPGRAVEAANLVAPYVSGIDVNAGCPKPFSTSGGMGAALLKTEEGDLLCRILQALVNTVGRNHEIGISVKIRLLETPEKTSKLVNKLCKTGIVGLTIHCRTTPMRPRERAIREQLRMIGEICRAHGVACLMNGDVTSREEGSRLAQDFNVDGAMIATAAEANSSVFRTACEGGLLPWREVVKQYLEYAMSVENKWGNTKFLLSQLMPGKDPVYQKVTMSRSYSALIEVLGMDTDTTMADQARAVDRVLQLDEPKTTLADIKRRNKAIAREAREAKLERKRAHEESTSAMTNTKSHGPEKKGRKGEADRPSIGNGSQLQKAEIAAENAGFDGISEGALAVAV